MKNLREVAAEIESRLDEKDQVRELALKSSRALIRMSGGAIRSLHRGEPIDEALRDAQDEAQRLQSLLKDHPDLYHGGFVENAFQEMCEFALVHAIIRGTPVPTPMSLGVTDASFLLGLGDAVGELRRFALEALRRDEVSAAEKWLEQMEELYDILIRFDYPNAIVRLKPKQDTARALIEKTRGEVAVSVRGKTLEAKIRELEERL